MEAQIRRAKTHKGIYLVYLPFKVDGLVTHYFDNTADLTLITGNSGQELIQYKSKPSHYIYKVHTKHEMNLGKYSVEQIDNKLYLDFIDPALDEL